MMMGLPKEQSWTGREGGSEQALKGRDQGSLKRWRKFRELEEQVGEGVGLGETEEVGRVMGSLARQIRSLEVLMRQASNLPSRLSKGFTS